MEEVAQEQKVVGRNSFPIEMKIISYFCFFILLLWRGGHHFFFTQQAREQEKEESEIAEIEIEIEKKKKEAAALKCGGAAKEEEEEENRPRLTKSELTFDLAVFDWAAAALTSISLAFFLFFSSTQKDLRKASKKIISNDFIFTAEVASFN